MIDSNPAKQGVDNPQRWRTEKRPFESWAQLDELAARLGPRYGPPVLFAAEVQAMDVGWMLQPPIVAGHDNGNTA